MPKGKGAKKHIVSAAAHQKSEDKKAQIIQNYQLTLSNKQHSEAYGIDVASKVKQSEKVLVSFLTNNKVYSLDVDKACGNLQKFCNHYAEGHYEITSTYFLLLGETYFKRWESKPNDKKLSDLMLKQAEDTLNMSLLHLSLNNSDYKAKANANLISANSKLTEIYLHKQEYDSWLECMTALLETNPRDTKLQLYAAEHYIIFNKVDKAYDVISKVHKAEKGNKLLKELVKFNKQVFESKGYNVDEILEKPLSPEEILRAELEKAKAKIVEMENARALDKDAEVEAKEAAKEASIKAENALSELAAIKGDKDAVENEAKIAQLCAIKYAMEISSLKKEIAIKNNQVQGLESKAVLIDKATKENAAAAASRAYSEGYECGTAKTHQLAYYAHTNGERIGFKQGVKIMGSLQAAEQNLFADASAAYSPALYASIDIDGGLHSSHEMAMLGDASYKG